MDICAPRAQDESNLGLVEKYYDSLSVGPKYIENYLAPMEGALLALLVPHVPGDATIRLSHASSDPRLYPKLPSRLSLQQGKSSSTGRWSYWGYNLTYPFQLLSVGRDILFYPTLVSVLAILPLEHATSSPESPEDEILVSTPDTIALSLHIAALAHNRLSEAPPWLRASAIERLPYKLVALDHDPLELLEGLTSSNRSHRTALTREGWSISAQLYLGVPVNAAKFFYNGLYHGCNYARTINWLGAEHELALEKPLLISGATHSMILRAALEASRGPLLDRLLTAFSDAGADRAYLDIDMDDLKKYLIFTECPFGPATRQREDALIRLGKLLPPCTLAAALLLAVSEDAPPAMAKSPCVFSALAKHAEINRMYLTVKDAGTLKFLLALDPAPIIELGRGRDQYTRFATILIGSFLLGAPRKDSMSPTVEEAHSYVMEKHSSELSRLAQWCGEDPGELPAALRTILAARPS